MNDREMECRDSLLSDRDFLYNMGQCFSKEQSNTSSRFDSFSLFGKLAVPSFFCGYLIAQAQNVNSKILSFLFVAICCVIVFFVFSANSNVRDKDAEYIFYYYILPNEIKNHILNKKIPDREFLAYRLSNDLSLREQILRKIK